MLSLSEITGKYIGKPYSEMPCMTLMHSIYTDLGFDVPDSFGKLTIDNYQEYFEQNPRLIQARMLQLIKSLGRPVNVSKIKIYDLLVIMIPGPALRSQRRSRVIFPAMYVGRRMFITSTITQGVIVELLNKSNKVLMARRLI